MVLVNCIVCMKHSLDCSPLVLSTDNFWCLPSALFLPHPDYNGKIEFVLWYVNSSLEKHLLPTEAYSPQNATCLAEYIIFIVSFQFRRDNLFSHWKKKTSYLVIWRPYSIPRLRALVWSPAAGCIFQQSWVNVVQWQTHTHRRPHVVG